MRNADSRVEIITDTQRFRALGKEWEELWSRANGQYHESFAVCWQSWVDIAQPRGSKLRCIVGRKDGRLVLVWPLAISRHAAWRVLRLLGPEAADYTSMLIEPGAAATGLARHAWDAASRHCGADVIRMPYFDEQSDLYRFASNERHRRFGERRSAAIARLSAESDWTSFCSALGTLSGKKPGALERRLAKQGTLKARLLTPADVEENITLVDWTLSRKREWALRVDKQGAWLYSLSYRNFLVSLLNRQTDEPAARLYLITLNDAPLATTIVGIGKSSIKGLITGFDERYAKYSPGQLVVEHMVKWAFDHHVDFDFGVGSESFKAYWSRNNTMPVASAQVALTAWGRIALQAKELVSKDASELRQWTLSETIHALRTRLNGKLKRQPAGSSEDVTAQGTEETRASS